MEFIKQHIEGVWVIQPKRFGDARGYFSETFKLEEFRKHVGDVEFVQDNESFSTYGVLRGLHFQKGEHSFLVFCAQKHLLDLRGGSLTYGEHVAVELTAEKGNQLFIPRGFAHGFVVLSDEAQFQYKVDNVYAPQSEATLKFDDPALGIDWQVPFEKVLLSAKDKEGMPLSAIKPF